VRLLIRFKRVSSFRDDAGDKVLATVARTIEGCASPHVCGRLRGEAFGVIEPPPDWLRLLGLVCLVLDRLAAIRKVLACASDRIAAGKNCNAGYQHPYK
jgi:GGDEF domain-containing protein